jgi:hypothetical protein
VSGSESRLSDAVLPKWLRNRGTVRNRHLTKHETETLIAEIWTSKLRSDETRAAALDVRGLHRLRCRFALIVRAVAQEFVQMFFKKKFGISTTVVEWGAQRLLRCVPVVAC